MQTLKWLCGSLVLILPALAEASGCVVRSRVIVHRAAPVVVVKRAVIAELVPVLAVAVQPYVASYAPPPIVPGPDVQGLVRELQALRAEVQALRGQGQPAPAAMPQANGAAGGAAKQAGAVNWVGILDAKCATCHTGPQAKGGFSMFTARGQPGQWTAAQIGRMMERMQQSGTKEQMPPPPNPPLTDQEFSEVNLGLARHLASSK